MAMNKQRRTSNISNIFSYDDAGNIVLKDYGQVTRYSWNGLIHGFIGSVSVSSVAAATTDTDKFLVSDGGVIKYRTGSEMLSDIGAQAAGSYVPTTRTLTINGTTYDLTANRSWTITAGVTGSGTTNFIPKWTSSTNLGNSIIDDDGVSASVSLSTNGSLNIKYLSAIKLAFTGRTTFGAIDLPVGIDFVVRPDSVEKLKLSSTGALKLASYGTGAVTGTSAYSLAVDATGNVIEVPGVTGTGTANYLPKFTGTGVLGNSVVYDNGTNIMIGSIIDGGQKLQVFGNAQVNHTYTHTTGVFTSGLTAYTNATTTGSSTYTNGMFYGAFQSYYRNNISSSVTVPNGSIVSSQFLASQVIFSSASTAVTMTQGSSIRAYNAQTIQFSFDNAQTACSVSHVAGIQIIAPYYVGLNNPTIDNYYGLIFNDSAEYSTTLTVTNRWAIYQDGASDNNYFRGKVVIGSTNTVGVSNLNVKNLPTSATGLASGDVWRNGTALNIVP